MPYIAVKGFPKDEDTKKKVAESINQIFLDVWGCPQEAVSISFEDVNPGAWEKAVVKPEMDPKADKMLIRDGKRMYE